ncbi:MAG: L,D-transpeptidase [Rhizobiales bacterium]|nr:L,D-transpeptidase [Hyphomicrobiales bacterium]
MSKRFYFSGLLAAVAMLLGLQGSFAPAQAAKIVAKIDLSQQRMNVYRNGRKLYSWRVSTGRGRYRTPTGSYRPTVLRRMHYSSKYNNAPMPHSIFFRGGYAVHGTNHIRRLGRPASHGCVRLHPRNAAKLFNLVRRSGQRNARIVITH